jgi:galactokinase
MDIRDLFKKEFNEEPQLIARAPGRVNLLGEHVDYNDGLVLPAAIDREVQLAASLTDGQRVNLYAIDLDERITFSLETLDEKVDVNGKPLPGWALYPAAVAWALQEVGLQVGGIRAVYSSDIPIGAGLSSSAAVEVGFGALWQALGGWEIDRLTLAKLCQRAENVYVGLSCGLMDQFASANGIAGHALCFDTRSLKWETAPLPQGTGLIIADSSVRRALTSSAYNQRRAECEQAVESLKHWMPGIQSLRDVSTTEFAAYSFYLPPVVRRRAEHVVKEIARVQSALSALRREDTRAFGALMYSGHASLRDLYEVSTPELDTLVEITRQLPGCFGSRLTGAGFGGCTISLVEEAKAPEFIQGLKDRYQQETGRQAQVYSCKASDGVSVRFTKDS